MDKETLSFRILPEMPITFTDYPDATSCAIIVYFCGCKHGCPGCHNYELQGFDTGFECDICELSERIEKVCHKAHTNKVVFSGGDIVYQDPKKINLLLSFLNNAKIDVCIYTGFDIDYIKSQEIYGAKFYKTGVYDERLRDKTSGKEKDYIRYATTNQRLYNKNYKLISTGHTYYFSSWKRFIKKIFK